MQTAASKGRHSGTRQFPCLSTRSRLIRSNSPELKPLFCKRLQAKRPSGNCPTSVLNCGVPPMSRRNNDFIKEVPIRNYFEVKMGFSWDFLTIIQKKTPGGRNLRAFGWQYAVRVAALKANASIAENQSVMTRLR